MKKIYYLLILLLFVACKKENQWHGQKLVEIRSATKTQNTFEYDGPRLTKMNF